MANDILPASLANEITNWQVAYLFSVLSESVPTRHQASARHPLPNAGKQAVVDFLDVVRVAGQLGLKRAVLKRGPDDHEHCGREAGDQCPPRAQQDGNADRLENKSHVARVAHKAIRSAAAHRVAAIHLNAYGRREERIGKHGP